MVIEIQLWKLLMIVAGVIALMIALGLMFPGDPSPPPHIKELIRPMAERVGAAVTAA